MTDFNRFLTNKLEDLNYCPLQRHQYASIEGIKVNCQTQQETPEKIYWICEIVNDKPALMILNGSTGGEAWYLEDLINGRLFNNEIIADFFSINDGIGGQWNGLKVPRQRMKQVVRELAEIYKTKIIFKRKIGISNDDLV